MNKKEREFCKKVMLSLNKEFRVIFNERMDLIRGDDKIIDKEILKDIESYRGNNKRKDMMKYVYCKNGYDLYTELQNYMRVRLGDIFGLNFYVLFSEYNDFSRMKNKKLGVNSYLYSYLMKSKKFNIKKDNFLFYIKDDEVFKLKFDKKLSYKFKSKYEKMFFNVDSDKVDKSVYFMLEYLTNQLYKSISKNYNINSKWYYLKEYFNYLKSVDYDKFLIEIFLRINDINKDYIIDEELIKNLCYDFRWLDVNSKFSKCVRSGYCDWNDKNKLIRWIDNFKVIY